MKNMKQVVGVIIALLLYASALHGQSQLEPAMKALKEENYTKAFSLLKSAAEKDKDDKASFHLAMLYYSGNGTAKDPQKAMEILNRLALRGKVDAMVALANIALDIEEPSAAQFETALKWFKKAAEMGDLESMKIVGGMYSGEYHQSIRPNVTEAYRFYRMAADKGDVIATVYICNMCFMGFVQNKPSKDETIGYLHYMMKFTFRPNTNDWAVIQSINACNIILKVNSVALDYEVTLPTDIKAIGQDGSFQYEGNNLLTKNLKNSASGKNAPVGKETLWNTTDLVKLDPKTDMRAIFGAIKHLNQFCKK